LAILFTVSIRATDPLEHHHRTDRDALK